MDKLEVEIGKHYKIRSQSAPTRFGVLHEVYRTGQGIRFSTGVGALLTQEGYDRFDFALLIRPEETHGMFTLWSKDGNTFEKTGYDGLEVTLANPEETVGLKESYKFD